MLCCFFKFVIPVSVISGLSSKIGMQYHNCFPPKCHKQTTMVVPNGGNIHQNIKKKSAFCMNLKPNV